MSAKSSPVMMEMLEPRMLLSATIDFADYASLDNQGEWWKYNTDYSVSPGGSGTAQQTVTVNNGLKKITGLNCTTVTTKMNGKSSSISYYTDDSGTYEMATVQASGNLTFKLTLAATQIAPATLPQGSPFTSDGSFTGKFTGSAQGYSFGGGITGDTYVQTTYTGNQQITVPAGTFDAARVTTSVSMSGDMVIHAAGQKVDATYSVTLSSTQWLVKDLGPVKASGETTVTVDIPAAHASQTVVTDTDSELTSSGWNKLTLVGPSAALKPGDVLLYKGKGFIASQIIKNEKAQLGGKAAYSHAAVYLGQGRVGEMLGGGYVESWIGDSIGASHVDFMHNSAIAGHEQDVVDAAEAYAGTPYAISDIGVLALVPKTGSVNLDTGVGAEPLTYAAYMATSRGASQLICSELVARAYSDAGVAVTVRPWSAMVDFQNWSADAQMDFTTPNMLLLGGSFTRVGGV